MITIRDLSKQTNITSRTLRYYDSIDLQRTIPFVQKVGFKLKEIQAILEAKESEPITFSN